MPIIDNSSFFQACRVEFKGTSPIKDEAALSMLLNFMWDDPAMTNPRQMAYLLATVKRETGHTMRPIPERGRLTYFNRYEPNTTSGKNLGNTHFGDGAKYKGQGYVQLRGNGQK